MNKCLSAISQALNAVDFEQLKIENLQHSAVIDAKNHELLALKARTTKAVQVG